MHTLYFLKPQSTRVRGFCLGECLLSLSKCCYRCSMLNVFLTTNNTERDQAQLAWSSTYVQVHSPWGRVWWERRQRKGRRFCRECSQSPDHSICWEAETPWGLGYQMYGAPVMSNNRWVGILCSHVHEGPEGMNCYVGVHICRSKLHAWLDTNFITGDFVTFYNNRV